MNIFNKSVESNQSVSKTQDSLLSNAFTKFIARSMRCSKSPGINMKLFESLFYHGALQGAMIAGPYGKNSANIWKVQRKSQEVKTKNGSNEKKRSFNESNNTQDPNFVKHKLRKQDEDKYETNGKSKIRRQNEMNLNQVTQRNINKYKDDNKNNNIDEKVSRGRLRGRTKALHDSNDSDFEVETMKIIPKNAQQSPRERKTEKFEKAIQDLNDDNSDLEREPKKLPPKTSNSRQKPVPVHNNTGYTGVKQDKESGKWLAFIKVPTSEKAVAISFSELHDTPAEAAKAHDFALIRAIGASEAAQLVQEENCKAPFDKLNFPVNDYALEPNEQFDRFDTVIKSTLWGTGYKGVSLPDFSFLMIQNNNTSKANSSSTNKANSNQKKLDQVNKLLVAEGKNKGQKKAPMSITNTISLGLVKQNNTHNKISAPTKTISNEECEKIGSLVKVYDVDTLLFRNGIILEVDAVAPNRYIIGFESSIEKVRGNFQAAKITKWFTRLDLIEQKDYSEADLMLLKAYKDGKFKEKLEILSADKKLNLLFLENDIPKKSENKEKIKRPIDSESAILEPLPISIKNEKTELMLKPKEKNSVKVNANLELPRGISSMCSDISVNFAVIIGEELSLLKKKIQGSLTEYPNVVSNWEKIFKTKAIKNYNESCIQNLRTELEEVATDAVFKHIFSVDFHGLVQNEGGFAIEFEPHRNINSIKYFEDDFSAAIVREQILDHCKLTTNNKADSVINYSQSNFTNEEWEYLKKIRDMIVAFGKIYKE